MDITSLTNPSVTFFKAYEGDILKTRDALFSELDKTSEDFGNKARRMLKKKLEANNNTPLLGELFPWIIKDLININKPTTESISVGWLAIYLYTLFLDEYVDNPKAIPASEFITGSLLAKTGLLKISRYTLNTPYENYIDIALSISAKNQQLDTEFKGTTTNLNVKESYSEGKNYVVFACAGALAAQNSQHADFIIQFTKQLLLTLQYLDDVADFNEDFNEENFTVLLQETFQDKSSINKYLNQTTRKELLSEIISTGSLQRIVDKIIALLNQSILLIRNQTTIENSKSSFEFFISLQTYCISLSNYLKSNQTSFMSLTDIEKEVILDRVENHMSLIAQSS